MEDNNSEKDRTSYFTSACVVGDNYYLELESLEQLPGLPKEG